MKPTETGRWLCIALAGIFLGIGPGLLTAQEKPIRLRAEVLRPAAWARGAGFAGAAEADRLHSGLFLVQFEAPPTAADRKALGGLGLKLVRYVPEDAFLVRAERPVATSELRAVRAVRWAGEFRPEWKAHPRLEVGVRPARPGEEVAVSLLLAPGSKAEEIAGARQALARIEQSAAHEFGIILRGRLPRGRLAALAQSPAVLWIEPGPEMRLYDEVAAKIVAGDGGWQQTGMQVLGYDGAGVTVAVADSGLHNGDAATMHPDLFGRVTAFFQYGNLTDAADEHSHGTHVAGIVAGNGAAGETDEEGGLYGLGVAPGARIVAQRMFDGLGAYEAPESFAQLTGDAKGAGADIGSNSWGDDTQGRYDLSAMEFDALVRDADTNAPGDQEYILEFSAGNAGPGRRTVGSPAVAKNVIATGASQNNRFDFFIYTEGEDAMADFSSRGPCEDGRIKPDLVAPGTWIASLKSASAGDENAWSPISDNYLYQGGTSQAGPQVSGGAAVFVQYYRETYQVTPSPALVKAALINSAVDMDEAGGTEAIPNKDEGWGRMDLTRLIGSDRDYAFVDQSVRLSTGEYGEQRVVIADAGEPLRVTLSYTDVPGYPAAIPALVNDLDLTVTGPDGVVYRGNQFQGGESIRNAPGHDGINNVEAVHVALPQPGEYVVQVRARSVVEDARRDTPGVVDQDYALVISGRFLPPGLSAVFLDRAVYRAPDWVGVIVLDPDQAGATSVTVRLSTPTEPAGELLVLFPAGGAGAFTNRLETAAGPAAADGQLQVAHGDTITVAYEDASAGATRTATALADLQAPLITGVNAVHRFGRTVVRWQTDEASDSRVYHGGAPGLVESARTNRVLTTEHEVALESLTPGLTYFFYVASRDVAGNAATNNNAGAWFSFTAPDPPAVLLVDGIVPGGDLFEPPLSRYAEPLTEIGVNYDVWSVSSLGSPAAADLAPYRVVIWRVPEMSFGETLAPAEQEALRMYLASGGSLFVASMELTTRLDADGASDFRRDVLQVDGYGEDAGVAGVVGVASEPISTGMTLSIDYGSVFDGYWGYDFSDTITPGTNAAGIFVDTSFGEFAGLKYPRTGVDSPWRLVFLSFPFDAVVDGADGVNTRAGLLRRVLGFLAPGLNGEGSLSFERGAYGIPALMTLELGDSDLEGQGAVTVTVRSTSEPGGQLVELEETVRPGVFRGSLTLVAASGSPAAGVVGAVDGDAIWAEYLDASTGQMIQATAVADTQAPVVTGVGGEADYMAAYVWWDTSEPSDALVQYGESLSLPINRTAYSSRLQTGHELLLNGLLPDRQYYYQVVSRDAAGNTTVDNNGGRYYTFRTLRPLAPPWTDALEAGATDWAVIDIEGSECSWDLGAPANVQESSAHSPVNAWGTNLRDEYFEFGETYLFSPAVDLSGATRATLRFWHSYDFSSMINLDALEGGELLIFTNLFQSPAATIEFADWTTQWTETTVDLSAYAGNVIFLAWHYYYFNLFLAVSRPPGWLIDDITVTATDTAGGVVAVSNNLAQASFVVGGPLATSGEGWGLRITNAPPGEYWVVFQAVPFYQTPPSQAKTLVGAETLEFQGEYGFDDVNTNGMADAWELDAFGLVSPVRDEATDSDGDGFPDGAEFVAGTDPLQADSKLTMTAPVPAGDGSVSVSWAAVPGRVYRLEGSSDAIHWAPVTDWQRASTAELRLTLPPSAVGGARLFRLEVRP